ncbi:type III secretion system translocator chaperone SicA [Yersinia nurmii]|uniref:Type III secretion system translocator chaperone SicA n=1 Tax=Yersinia nurmii TaxID=685706 RepID=A0AAW7JU56_9GAMM|nr:type III secretion system translocator chaperone SicA [Yersinia nurmii]MDN0086149.1 type III secretion system translocator chaperone SicA [Yersinia nurmii]
MTQENTIISDNEIENMLWAALNQGAMLKDIHGVSDEMMEHIYAHAYQFYHKGHLDEAENFFSFLCMYDLNNTDYFIGLGAVNQLKKNYQKACDLYSLAYVMGKDNFSPVFFSGQCQLLMGNFVKAMQCFDLVCKRSNDENLIKKAKVYLETIRQNRKETNEEAD